MWTVRPATVSDLETLVDGNKRMALETEDRTLDASRLQQGCLALLEHPERGRYLVAENDRREVVGQLMLTYEWSDWRNGTFWWIQSVYVAPDWRRQGVYRALHEFVKREASADRRVCGIRLYVYQTNRRAKQTYEAVGMSSCGYEVFEAEL